MKVLITTDLFKPSVIGVVTSVLNLKRGLEAKGHEVRILTLSPNHHSFIKDNVYYIGSIDTGRIYPGTRFRLHCPKYIKKMLIDWQPDIVHSQCELSTFSIAAQIAKACNVPLIHTYHTVYEDYTHYFCPVKPLGRRLVQGFTKHILDRTDAVIAPSTKVSGLLARYNVNSPVSVIPTGIDLSAFADRPASADEPVFTGRPASADKSAFTGRPAPAAEPSLTGRPAFTCRQVFADNTVSAPSPAGNPLKLIFVGRLAKEKNIAELLHMVAFCRDLPIELIIVGDGPERNELIRLSKELDIENMVTFAGMVPPEKVSACYHLGDVFVNASNSETQGLTYIEAMASGLAMLCRKDACLDGIVTEGVNGWQYENPEQFKTHIIEMLEDADLRTRLGRGALAASRRFSIEYFAGSVEHLYLSARRMIPLNTPIVTSST